MAFMMKHVGMMLACLGVLAGGCLKTESAGSGTKYTCPMHPEVVQKKAGDCPKCGMKLVEKRQ